MMRYFAAVVIALALAGRADAQTLVGWWIGPAFNPAASTTVPDESGNGRTGTLTGGDNTVTIRVDGPAGASQDALQLDGTADYIVLSGMPNVNTVTFAAWVKLTALGNYPMLLTRGTTATDGNLGAELRFNGAAGWPEWTVDLSPGALPSVNYQSNVLNSWTHLAATFDGTNQRLYVNGVLRGSATNAAAGIAWGATPLANIGRRASGASNYMAGAVYDVRVYEGALSEGQINSVMSGRAVRPRGLGLRLGIGL